METEGVGYFNFLNEFPNFYILVLLHGFENVRNVILTALKLLFFLKKSQNRVAAAGSTPKLQLVGRFSNTSFFSTLPT